VIVAVDTSGSMGAEARIAATKGAVLGLLTDAYQQRDRVALVAFRGEDAEVVLRPTGSVEVARARLAELPVGGTTPLAAGLDAVRDLAERAARAHDLTPVVVLVTDGRATAGGDDPLAEARAAADRLAALGAPTLVVDAEDPAPPRLGLATDLAVLLGARCVPLGELDARAIRTATA
jgi:magnesium chelatase subunit D